MPRVRQAIVAPDGAALRPPETGLSGPALLPCRSQLARPIVGTRAARSCLACSVLEAVDNAVKGIAAYWDAAGEVEDGFHEQKQTMILTYIMAACELA